jgi:uncharacterized integral membrane protein
VSETDPNRPSGPPSAPAPAWTAPEADAPAGLPPLETGSGGPVAIPGSSVPITGDGPSADLPLPAGDDSTGRSAVADTGTSVPAPGFDQRGKVGRTMVSGVWVGLIATALFLILLIVFIGQNSRAVTIHFLGWKGHFSLALTILLSAVGGVLLVAIPGSVRILQLRRALRKNVPTGRLTSHS